MKLKYNVINKILVKIYNVDWLRVCTFLNSFMFSCKQTCVITDIFILMALHPCVVWQPFKA
jgi:hypothetical protein